MTHSVARVLLLGPDDATAEAWRERLAQEPAVQVMEAGAPDESRVPGLVRQAGPDVVVVDQRLPGGGLQAARVLAEVEPLVPVVLVAADLGADLYRGARAAGVVELVQAPPEGSELAAAIARAHREGLRRRQGAGQAPPVERPSTMLATFGPKGGVGKTTVAANLAVALAARGKTVALLDLHLAGGHAALALDLAPERTVADLVSQMHRLDPDLLEGYLVRDPSGAKLLAAPPRPVTAELVAPAHVERVVKVLRPNYEFILADLPPEYAPVAMAAMEQAQILLLVVTPDLPALRSARLGMGLLRELNYPEAKVKVVLNRADARGAVPLADVEATLGARVYAVLPEDPAALGALNEGTPVLVSRPRSPLARALRSLAGLVTGAGPAPAGRVPWLPWRRKGG